VDSDVKTSDFLNLEEILNLVQIILSFHNLLSLVTPSNSIR
jgi:hypothetical protein